MNLLVLRTDGSSVERPTVTVPIRALQPADSPRIDGENQDHARILAELKDHPPPITVHRPTMRVVDGMHRLLAAKLRGQDSIEVEFVDGPEDELFVLAVQANVTHGLPLTLSDRKAAARRIVRMHPAWSDRKIASVAGLSDKTVGALRRRAAADGPQLHGRLGSDGRLRPVSAAEGRKRAGELLARKPTASLREISAEAGVSMGTVRDVRNRLRLGKDPTLVPRQVNRAAASDSVAGQAARASCDALGANSADPAQLLQSLRTDPSLRLSESGRMLLRILETCVLERDMWDRVLSVIPEHCRPAVAHLASQGAAMWREVGQRLNTAPCSLT